MRIFYNEFDKFAVAWLKQLIMFGAIPDGDIDERSITEIEAWELLDYDQCHFFAGIGGWSEALRLANWHGPIWTGSCPCQPFSVAGAQQGTNDKRHLWPEFLRLIRVGRPPVVVGEQVASKLGREWLAGVRTDLEDVGYAVGAADLCAAGVGAPHIRQRLYWVGHAERDTGGPGRSSAEPSSSTQAPRAGTPVEPGRSSDTGAGRLLHATGSRCDGPRFGAEEEARNQTRLRGPEQGRSANTGRLADADGGNTGSKRKQPGGQHGQQQTHSGAGSGLAHGHGDRAERDEREEDGTWGTRGSQSGGSSSVNSWGRGVFVPCLDGKARRVEPGIFPLADGFSNRVGALRGSGNAIVPQVGAKFIEAVKEIIHER